MDWLTSLFLDNSTIAHDVVVYSLVIAIGVLLGKVKFFGISLGVTFVLFVGIFMGHIGFDIGNPDLLKFIREFGLILFVFSIGLQVGPGFFSSFKKGGMQMNFVATMTVLLNVVVAIAIYYMDSDITIPQIVGILSGAVTNTPGLGAAQQALESMGKEGIDALSMGYAAAYPLGVIGIILSMILLKVFFRIKVENEVKEIEDEQENSQLKPHVVTFAVENKLIDGKTVRELNEIVEHHFVISRMKKTSNGEIIIPTSKTVLSCGDLLLIVCSAQDEAIFSSVIGKVVDHEWESVAHQGEVVSRRILVTNPHYNGRTLGSLRLHYGYKLNATRVNRAGMDLIANPNLELQVGDRLTVVGDPSHIERLSTRLGNSMKRLHEPNMFTMFIGIFIGIIVGLIPISIPGMSASMQLGLAGGPLVVAILIARFGYKFKLVTYTSTSASLMLREIGICLFLASVGISAGGNFFDTVFNAQGLKWVLWGFIITVLPLIIMSVIARWKFKFNYLSILGIMSGSYTDPPALAYANKVANNDAPAVAYSTVYPLTMFLRVITAQLLVLIFA